MKNEQYFKLLPIERQLRSAIESNYARLSATEFAVFCGAYKEVLGVELTRSEQNCNVCRLKALKKLGKEYFDYQNWYIGRWGRKPEESASEPENNENLNTEQNAQGNSEGDETQDE